MSSFLSKKKLFLCSSFNGLTQKIWVHYANASQDRVMIGVHSETIHQFQPDLIICPYLKEYIPQNVWESYPCFVIHPGPPDDGGPTSLNWAILENQPFWGVSVIQANEGWDTGPLWATHVFSLPQCSVVSTYRNQVADGALLVLPQAIERYYSEESSFDKPLMKYRKRITSEDLSFSWTESTDDIIRKINAGDSIPGTCGIIGGQTFYLFNASKGEEQGDVGQVLKQKEGRICVGAGDGSIWISHMASDNRIKLRAAELLPD